MQSVDRASVDDTEEGMQALRHERHGQLAQIFRVLGIPTMNELAWASPDAAERTMSLIRSITKPPISYSPWADAKRLTERRDMLREQVPAAPADALDLFVELLSIDVRARPSAADALGHAYFNELPPMYISYALPPEVQHAHLAAVEAAFAFEQQALTLPQLREMLYEEVLKSSHELRGPAARANTAMQTVRRLRASKKPWMQVLPQPDGAGSAAGTAGAAGAAGTGDAAGAPAPAAAAEFDSRAVTVALCRLAFGCADEWEPVSPLLDGVMTRGTPGAETVMPEAEYAAFCAALLRGMDKYLVKLNLTCSRCVSNR
mmetsp:Transcript_56993/g.169438  ORF Transcript_56993/g.169438 Transcript_56993/m.169438 type:complete len:317 (-) Transcript_56993:500-1450(-)